MACKREKPDVGEQVIFLALPRGLLEGLPEEDQRAISAMVGKPVTLVSYDEDGRAALAFAEAARRNHHHTIWVAPEFVAPIQA
jgi:hypothetical protein